MGTPEPERKISKKARAGSGPGLAAMSNYGSLISCTNSAMCVAISTGQPSCPSSQLSLVLASGCQGGTQSFERPWAKQS